MADSAKDSCPNCKTRLVVGRLPSRDELDKLVRAGGHHLGEMTGGEVDCPSCGKRLRVAVVRLGNFFSLPR